MTISKATAKAIAETLCDHLKPQIALDIVIALKHVPGNASFTKSMELARRELVQHLEDDKWKPGK